MLEYWCVGVVGSVLSQVFLGNQKFNKWLICVWKELSTIPV